MNMMTDATSAVPSALTGAESDEILLDRFRQGEEEAATYLYQRYATRLRAMAQHKTASDLSARVEPDDIVQSAFRSFFRRAAAGQYHVPASDDLWKLLFVITLHKIHSQGSHHRAARRDVRATVSGEKWFGATPANRNLEDVACIELRLLIDDMLAKLPEVQQRMIQLRMEGHEV
ncbi:MAG: RNA polymerase sigma factor, partial [Planctomycetia bacterium]